MDPLSVAAMVALVYAAKSKSKKEPATVDNSDYPTPPLIDPPMPDPPKTVHDKNMMPFFGTNNGLPAKERSDNRSAITSAFTGQYSAEGHTAGVIVPKDSSTWGEDAPGSFSDIIKGRNPFGSPVVNLSDRINQNLSNKMNNLSPVQKQYVGPGLGIPGNVPAYGGFQQLYRVLPNNVGGYKMNTLPGRTGPANGNVIGQRGLSQIGHVGNYTPDTTITGADRGPAPLNAQGQGDPLLGNAVRGRYINTEAPTRRSETTLRQDGLEFVGALSMVPRATEQERPTRNKGDMNTALINDTVTPGIYSFHGAYDSSAPNDIRATPNRGKVMREGNAGNMNLRMDPTNQEGYLTKVKDTPKCSLRFGTPGPTGNNVGEGYERPEFYNLNTMKGYKNPRATSRGLGVARKELAGNPFAIKTY